MYIKKSVLFGIVIFFLVLFLIGEYFYLDNKFSPVVVKISKSEGKTFVKNEKKIEVQTSLTPTIDNIKGASIQATFIPTVTPSLNIQQVQNYLNTLLTIKPAWKNVKDKISSEDFNFLMDSFDRQISFCQTIIDHLSKDPNPNEDDLKLWDGIQKMWSETGELTTKLNKELAK